MIRIRKKKFGFISFRNRRFLGRFKTSFFLTGFTLVELTAVFGIIGLLATLVFANYQAAKKRYLLSETSQEIVAQLRNAQNMTLAGTKIKESKIKESEIRGYGIRFYSDKYICFGDKTWPDAVYNEPEDNLPGDDLVETFNLPPQIKIDTSHPSLNIFFEFPDGRLYINGAEQGGFSPPEKATITLKFNGTSLKKTITVGIAGVMEVD
ncbi:MAG: type II secretion system protein [Patescibacteria group bacterium]|nr:type II secretion system protein [Patescibacteria group bacterium]